MGSTQPLDWNQCQTKYLEKNKQKSPFVVGIDNHEARRWHIWLIKKKKIYNLRRINQSTVVTLLENKNWH